MGRARSMTCATAGARRPTHVSSTVACVRRSRLAAIAGLSVSAMKTESAIAETIVAEN